MRKQASYIGIWTTLSAAALLAAGCGSPDVGAGRTVAVGTVAPYEGPLWVSTPTDDDDPYTTGGAAARALECAGDPYFAGNDVGEGWGSPDGGASPAEALNRFADEEGTVVPSSGYRTEREESGRTLFSFDDASGRTKAAVIVAKDRPERPGWGMETFAVCDPAEYPPGHDGELELHVWTDRADARVPVRQVHSRYGSDHCGWDDILFLSVGEGADAPQYVRDTTGELPADMLEGTYAASTALPADAKDTGYRRAGGALWLAADGGDAYLKTADGVERWPGTRETIACH